MAIFSGRKLALFFYMHGPAVAAVFQNELIFTNSPFYGGILKFWKRKITRGARKKPRQVQWKAIPAYINVHDKKHFSIIADFRIFLRRAVWLVRPVQLDVYGRKIAGRGLNGPKLKDLFRIRFIRVWNSILRRDLNERLGLLLSWFEHIFYWWDLFICLFFSACFGKVRGWEFILWMNGRIIEGFWVWLEGEAVEGSKLFLEVGCAAVITYIFELKKLNF